MLTKIVYRQVLTKIMFSLVGQLLKTRKKIYRNLEELCIQVALTESLNYCFALNKSRLQVGNDVLWL